MNVIPTLLHPNQYGQFENHLKRLSPVERELRFDYKITDDQIERYVRNIKSKDFIIGVRSSNQLIGAAHLSGVRDNATNDSLNAELGISVEKEFQGLGIGTELLSFGVDFCKRNKFVNLTILCKPDNYPMIHLAKKFEARFTTKAGQTFAIIPLGIDFDDPENENKSAIRLTF